MDQNENDTYFNSFDYLVFAAMLFVSSLVGVYFAFFAKVKQNTVSEYLMGGKMMGIFPISMSLIASDISGVSILGIPAEIYIYGTQFGAITVSQALVSLTMILAYLPVFYKLQIISSYEYLNLRFNQTVRLLGSLLFLTKMLLYIPIVIYVPALAFNQVTGINLHLITPVVCIVCIFYTTLGGLKAVVWTDAIQTIVMFGALIAVTILGIINVGGFGQVWTRSEESGRIEFFNFDLNPTIRHTFWTVSTGYYFSWLATCSINQATVQRCLSIPSLRSANITIIIFVIGVIATVWLSCYMGLVIFAYYYKCDPLTKGLVNKPDQLLPYFVMHIAASIPGLPGLFVSGVFSAALSTMSTGLNSMTGVIFEDLIKPTIKKPLSEGQASFLMKVMVVIIGSICVALVFIVEKMGTLVQATNSLGAIAGGPLLGIFTLGMLFPIANSKGALIGGLISGCLIGWVSIGTQMNIAQGIITFPQKYVSVEECSTNWIEEHLNSISLSKVNDTVVEPPFILYRLSYMYYTLVGTLVTVIIGLLVSFVTGGNVQEIHKDLLSPVIYRFLKRSNNSVNTDNKNEIMMSNCTYYISGITVLGIPAEIYTYGTQFWIVLISEVFVALTMAYAFLPVFYKLQITSSYEYLNLRFNQTVRLLGSILFLTKMLLYIPIVVYVPALAFSQVTGINLHLITPVVCIVCIFYTTLGGLKAVVWTDTIQSIVMFGALIAIIILGTLSAGGFNQVWTRSEEGGRIDFFNFDLDPTIRHSFWTVSIGNYFSWLANCSINQAMVQRCLAMPLLKSARITVAILTIGIMAMISMCCYMGLVIFAYYYKCDPITRGSVHKSDQLLLYFVMHIAASMPGLPGLFVSGVFSAALSSMSTGLNSMTGVIFEDLIKPRMKKPLSEGQASFLMKVIVVIIGSICVALVFIVEKMGALIQATNSLLAITAGPLLGVFTLGMFFPTANPKGALIGGLISGCLIGWISVGTQMNMAQGVIRFPQKYVSVEGCNANWIAEHLSLTLASEVKNTVVEPPFILYRLSYMYYTLLGTITTIVIAVAARRGWQGRQCPPKQK